LLGDDGSGGAEAAGHGELRGDVECGFIFYKCGFEDGAHASTFPIHADYPKPGCISW
jgi:hypothetical protein